MENTAYETEILRARMEEYLPALVHLAPAALHRMSIVEEADGRILCYNETNDDNDDGYPDGDWSSWTAKFPTIDAALRSCGKCRVGISGVIVTVTVDGKEVR